MNFRDCFNYFNFIILNIQSKYSNKNFYRILLGLKMTFYFKNIYIKILF